MTSGAFEDKHAFRISAKANNEWAQFPKEYKTKKDAINAAIDHFINIADEVAVVNSMGYFVAFWSQGQRKYIGRDYKKAVHGRKWEKT